MLKLHSHMRSTYSWLPANQMVNTFGVQAISYQSRGYFLFQLCLALIQDIGLEAVRKKASSCEALASGRVFAMFPGNGKLLSFSKRMTSAKLKGSSDGLRSSNSSTQMSYFRTYVQAIYLGNYFK